ncbi:MAG: ATP-binding protein [Desulfosporosinus sp.]|nr:ATP-binding protein [Desulfosporosinus sp.]
MTTKIRHSWSISIKLWLALTLLILTVLGGLGLTITWLFGDFYLQIKLDSLKTEATEISEQLATIPNWSERLSLLETLKLTSGTQLVLLDPQGNVLVRSGSSSNVSPGLHSGVSGPYGGVNGLLGELSRNIHISDFFTDEYLALVLSGKTISIKALPINGWGQTMLLAATPVGANPVQGVVLLGSSPIPIQESITTFRWLILYASLIAILLATVISLFFARQVTRPLALMQRGATQMAKGDFLPIQGVNSNDEIGELAESLNSMGESLKNHMEWLSQEKNLLQGIVESISDAVVMLSYDGLILYANDSAKALWQENEIEFEERKTQIINFLQTMTQNDDYQGENYQTFALGTQILQVVMAPTVETEGIRGHVAVLHDVTASLRAEKARREFLASVTHELRTPLHLIQGYLEAIQDDVIPEHQQGEHIELVLEEAKRLARLVKDLQDINWLERGQSLQRVSIDLESFMSDLDQRFQGRAQELGLKLEVSPGSGELFADPDRLLQVFINLIDNAMSYTPCGKTVRVFIEEELNQVQFAVQDEGEGIPKEALLYIFDSFFRVNKARCRKDGGMGLGLAIVRQIVEAHGGTIKVESDMGKGTTFWIALPREPS